MDLNGVSQRIIRQIDQNNNQRIDAGDDLELARMFGFKENDKLNEKSKIQENITNYDSKMEAYDKAAGQGNKPASDSVLDNANQLVLFKKGLDPNTLKSAGFETVSIIETEEGSKLLLKSNDGYELEISEPQDENNVVIARDADGKLVLSGIKGNLNITKGMKVPPEVILSDIYQDNVDEPTLTITNNSGLPLTRTYPQDSKGVLSFDAASVLHNEGFPVEQALYGAFTQVSITEDANGEKTKMNLSSSKHGFVLNFNPIWEGDQPFYQSSDIRLHYSQVNKRLTIDKLQGPAELDITEDGNQQHELYFSNSEIIAENKTRKPLHIRELVMDNGKNGKTRDNSAFTYKTQNNFDTFDKQRMDSVDLSLTLPGGVNLQAGKALVCPCSGKTEFHIFATKKAPVEVNLHLWDRVVTSDQITLAPGDYMIKPDEVTTTQRGRTKRKRPTYTDEEKLHHLTCNDKGKNKKISAIDLNDYVRTRAAIYSTGEIDNRKISRSGVNWGNLGITTIDNSTNVNGDGNIVVSQHGNNNTAQILSNPVPVDQKLALLQEQYHLNTDMFKKAGFGEVSFNYENGKIKDIVFVDTKNDVRLTLPADEAFLFSEQMNIKRNKQGELELTDLVGTLEGSGMKINCNNSNVDLAIIDHDIDNGYLRYRSSDLDNKNQKNDGIHISYSGESASNSEDPVLRIFYGDNKKPQKYHANNHEFGSWIENGERRKWEKLTPYES